MNLKPLVSTAPQKKLEIKSECQFRHCNWLIIHIIDSPAAIKAVDMHVWVMAYMAEIFLSQKYLWQIGYTSKSFVQEQLSCVLA